MIKRTKPRKACLCENCEHSFPSDDKLCSKGHKPRLYNTGGHYIPYEFKRRCEDFKRATNPNPIA